MKSIKLKYILPFLAVLTVFNGYSQEPTSQEEAEIIMTQTQLDSLLYSIAEKKRYLIRLRRERYEQEQEYAKRIGNTEASSSTLSSNTNKELNEELKAIRYSMDSLLSILSKERTININITEGVSANRITVEEVDVEGNKFEQKNGEATKIEGDDLQEKTNKSSSNSLEKNQSNNPDSTGDYKYSENSSHQSRNKKSESDNTRSDYEQANSQGTNNNFSGKIDVDTKESSKTEENQSSTYTTEENDAKNNPSDKTSEDLLKEEESKDKGLSKDKAILNPQANFLLDSSQYKSYTQQELKDFHQVIYFPNDSFEISDKNKAVLYNLSQSIIEQGGKYSIIIQGYASAVGGEVYNRGISYLRASYIKDLLLENGLKPYKIIVEAVGIDKTSSEEKARRVEVKVETGED